MTLSIGQNALLYLVYFFMLVISLVDRYLTFSIQKVTKTIFLTVLYGINVLFILFIFYSFHSGDISLIADGFYTGSYFPSSIKSTGQVLGASSKVELPVVVNDFLPPEISAKSVLVYDVGNARELYTYNSTEKYAPASTTKLMTALISLDIYSLEDKLTVPGECTLVDSTRVNFPSGDVFTVRNLLYSLLIYSAGDSACVLSNGAISYDEFINRMNTKAAELGMENSRFTNPVGLDGANGGHYSTAEDLLTLSLAAISDPTITRIVSTPAFIMSAEESDFSETLINTNRLLWEIPQSVGIKTGTTQEAGEVLIYEFQDELRTIIIIVMGSDDRFRDTRELLYWILSKYSWELE